MPITSQRPPPNAGARLLPALLWVGSTWKRLRRGLDAVRPVPRCLQGRGTAKVPPIPENSAGDRGLQTASALATVQLRTFPSHKKAGIGLSSDFASRRTRPPRIVVCGRMRSRQRYRRVSLILPSAISSRSSNAVAGYQRSSIAGLRPAR